MTTDLNNIIHLSDNEIQIFLGWAKELQVAHAKECDALLDGISITFEITNLGTTVVAHTGCAPLSGAHVVLREGF